MRSGNSGNAIDDTVRRLAPGSWQGLGLRVTSSLVLAPPILVALYVGAPYSDILVLVTGAIAVWEWARMCRHGRWDWLVNLAMASVAASLAAGMAGHYGAAGWLIAAGVMAVLFGAGRDDQADGAWLGVGVAYVGAACLAFLWLRHDPANGLAIVFWLLAVVWSTDIGAYFAGRTIGGPKLAPSISPKKTWAGLGGGMLAATVAGLVAAKVGGDEPLRLGAASAALAIAAQAGDLFESSLKRRYGVKDSSALIPGHGGVLDRIDGLLAVALVFGGVSFMTGATG